MTGNPFYRQDAKSAKGTVRDKIPPDSPFAKGGVGGLGGICFSPSLASLAVEKPLRRFHV